MSPWHAGAVGCNRNMRERCSTSARPMRQPDRRTLCPRRSRRPEWMRSLAAWAEEWGNRGIRGNGIAPGRIPTEGAFSRLLPRADLEQRARQRIPSGRFGTIEELADLAAFLVSDRSGYINGEVVRMDGGELLQGAGEFSALGRSLTEKEWGMMKPKKQ